MADYDLLGNIVIIKSELNGKLKTKKQKLEQAKKLLKRPSVETVLEKGTNVQGRLRTVNVKHIAGKKNLVAEYKENGCVFKFNVKTCYFSSRLSSERKLIADKVKRNDNVLVMFAGIGVYPLVIYKNSKPTKIVGVELGRDCCKWFKENLKLNKIPKNRVEVIQGDVKKKVNKEFINKHGKFSFVFMARPNLKETFLKYGLKASKKGTRLFYYGFCNRDEIDDLIKELVKEAKGLKRKIKFVKKVKAGDIAPYKFRYRIEFKVLD